MSEEIAKKFLDQKGVEYLWSKINIEDYPNNQTLEAIINAIDQIKADKTDLPEEPLKGITLEITPNEVLLALITGRQIILTHEDEVYGNHTFNHFTYNNIDDSVSSIFYLDDIQLKLNGLISTNMWELNKVDTTIEIDKTLTIDGAAADAKTVGNKISTLQSSEKLNHYVTTADAILEIDTINNTITLNEGYIYHKGGSNVFTIAETTMSINRTAGVFAIVYDVTARTVQSINPLTDFNGTKMFLIAIFWYDYMTHPNANYINGPYKVNGVIYNDLSVDNTLSVAGMAADAAAVGEAIAFPKYVAQDTAPEDTNLLWIDTSDEVGTAANPKTEIILKSSTAGSTKQFRITINDDGILTATEIG